MMVGIDTIASIYTCFIYLAEYDKKQVVSDRVTKVYLRSASSANLLNFASLVILPDCIDFDIAFVEVSGNLVPSLSVTPECH